MTAVDTPAPRIPPETALAEELQLDRRKPEAPTRRVRSSALRWFLYALLTAITLVFIYPFIWLVSASFKPEMSAARLSGTMPRTAGLNRTPAPDIPASAAFTGPAFFG